MDEEEAINRLAAKERMIDPNLYPKLKGARGVFRLNEIKVENHIVVSRALAGDSDTREARKAQAGRFNAYLISQRQAVSANSHIRHGRMWVSDPIFSNPALDFGQLK